MEWLTEWTGGFIAGLITAGLIWLAVAESKANDEKSKRK